MKCVIDSNKIVLYASDPEFDVGVGILNTIHYFGPGDYTEINVDVPLGSSIDDLQRKVNES